VHRCPVEQAVDEIDHRCAVAVQPDEVATGLDREVAAFRAAVDDQVEQGLGMHLGHRPGGGEEIGGDLVEPVEPLRQDPAVRQEGLARRCQLVRIDRLAQGEQIADHAEIGDPLAHVAGHVVQHAVAPDAGGELVGDVLEDDDIADRPLRALALRPGRVAADSERDTALERVVAELRGADDEAGEAVRVIGVPAAAETIGETHQRVTEGLGGDHAEERAAEADIARDVEDLQRPLVVEQDLMLEIADDDTLLQVAQDGGELLPLLLRPRGRLRDGPVDLAASLGHGRRQLADRRAERAEMAGRARGHRPLGPGVGGRPQVIGDGQQRPCHALVELEPDPGGEAEHDRRGGAAKEHEMIEPERFSLTGEQHHGADHCQRTADADQREEEEEAEPETGALAPGPLAPRPLAQGSPFPRPSRSRTVARSSSIEKGLVR
jgi:hypothetical protein